MTTGYRNIKKELIKRYGQETVQRIWEKAGANWEELCARYAHLPVKMKQHTDGQMFRMAAVYMALKEVFPEQALEILGTGVEREGRRIAKILSCALHIPGMDYVFLRIFAKMLDSSFNEDAGFQSTKHCISKDEVYFDINECPYKDQSFAARFISCSLCAGFPQGLSGTYRWRGLGRDDRSFGCQRYHEEALRR